MAAPDLLPLDQLLSHACTAARADEQRHAHATLHADHTLRGWGDAALSDLEWSSHCRYTPVEHKAYRVAYAGEYRRLRGGRAS